MTSCRITRWPGGITDDVTPIVAMLYGVVKINPGLVDTLLDPGKVSLEHRGIALPLSGDVDLVIVRTSPGATRSMDLLEHSVRTAEELMGEPLPTGYVGLLFENAVSGSFAGTNFGTHIAIRPKFDMDDNSHEADSAGHVIAHEVAHYYWSGNADWVDEGAADFMASAIESERTGKPVNPTNDPCAYVGSIAELEALAPDTGSDVDVFDCNYSLGERLFVDMYRALGGEAIWHGLRELYIASQVEDTADDNQKGTPVSIEHVREAFQSDQPTTATVTARWYDGTEPYDVSQLDSNLVWPHLTTINGLIDRAYITIGKDGPEVSSFSAQDVDDHVLLNLNYSYDVTGGPHEVSLDTVEFYEDGFEFDRHTIKITAEDQYVGGTSWITVGPGPGDKWAPGHYWVYVYNGDQKVAEVQYKVTP